MRWRAFLADRQGSTLVEMALSMTAMLTLFLSFVEVCLLLYSRNMISESARAGTRYAMFHGASCPNSNTPTCEVTASQVNSYVSGLGWPNLAGGTMSVATTYPDSSEAVGSRVQVKVTYLFPVNVPFVPTQSVTLTSTSETYIIQ